LTPEQEVTVVFERTWNSSSTGEGEFPPSYIVEIGYDPDIRLDGNLNSPAAGARSTPYFKVDAPG
jgi:hypothetical protein